MMEFSHVLRQNLEVQRGLRYVPASFLQSNYFYERAMHFFQNVLNCNDQPPTTLPHKNERNLVPRAFPYTT